MSGRELNGWGECVWCGEMLKPEDPEPRCDHCEFCRKWNELAQLVIKRKFYTEKKMNENKDNQKAFDYWKNKHETYQAIHKVLIDALNLKKIKLYGESY